MCGLVRPLSSSLLIFTPFLVRFLVEKGPGEWYLVVLLFVSFRFLHSPVFGYVGLLFSFVCLFVLREGGWPCFVSCFVLCFVSFRFVSLLVCVCLSDSLTDRLTVCLFVLVYVMKRHLCDCGVHGKGNTNDMGVDVLGFGILFGFAFVIFVSTRFVPRWSQTGYMEKVFLSSEVSYFGSSCSLRLAEFKGIWNWVGWCLSELAPGRSMLFGDWIGSGGVEEGIGRSCWLCGEYIEKLSNEHSLRDGGAQKRIVFEPLSSFWTDDEPNTEIRNISFRGTSRTREYKCAYTSHRLGEQSYADRYLRPLSGNKSRLGDPDVI